MSVATLPVTFVWRRLHSLMGLWLVLFLMEHLLVNSQAALLWGENAKGFIDAVNTIHNLPYLQAIEIFLLGMPFAIHMVLGVRYLFTAKSNSSKTDGSAPSLPKYARNKAYSWQRITSWILLICIIGHVAKFRFLEYPWSAQEGTQTSYFVKVKMDRGLYTVADRLGVALYDKASVAQEKEDFENRKDEISLLDASQCLPATPEFNPDTQTLLTSAQNYNQKMAWIKALTKKSIHQNEVIAVSPSFGTATLLSVREAFQNPIYVALYTIFVLAACFHAFNGFWTFLITWGMILKISSQKSAGKITIALMLILVFLGLSSIWGTYWINLKS